MARRGNGLREEILFYLLPNNFIRQEGIGVNKGFSGHGLKTVLDLDCKNGVVRRSWFHR